MPRPLRPLIPGGIYHITSKGNRGQATFLDDYDRGLFLHLAATVVKSHGWRCDAYCLMTNHYHLLVQTPDPNLSDGMQRLNGDYAQWFNHLHGFEGHLFQDRFGSRVVETPAHLLEVMRYVVMNPVRAGICREPADWPWSSFASMLGLAPRHELLTVDWTLRQFSASTDRARERLRAFVADARAEQYPL
jgi:REP element-mobilizing transposase RayT